MKKPVRVTVTGAAGQIGYALLFRIRDDKIVEAQNFLTDMYQSDAFYWEHFPLKPIPQRLIGG